MCVWVHNLVPEKSIPTQVSSLASVTINSFFAVPLFIHILYDTSIPSSIYSKHSSNFKIPHLSHVLYINRFLMFHGAHCFLQNVVNDFWKQRYISINCHTHTYELLGPLDLSRPLLLDAWYRILTNQLYTFSVQNILCTSRRLKRSICFCWWSRPRSVQSLALL